MSTQSTGKTQRQLHLISERFQILNQAVREHDSSQKVEVRGFPLLGDLKKSFVEFDRSYLCGKYSSQARTLFMFLVFTGKYVDQYLITKWSTLLLAQGMDVALSEFFQSDFFLNSFRSKLFIHLKPALPDALYVDVSHTVSYPYNSGIQRVVRKVSSSFLESGQVAGKKVQFYRIDSESGQPLLLGPDEIERLRRYDHPKQKLGWIDKLRWACFDLFLKTPRRILGYLKEDIGYIAWRFYHRWRDHYLQPWSEHFVWARNIFYLVDKNKAQVKYTLGKIQPSLKQLKSKLKAKEETHLLFINNDLLLPECPLEEKVIHFYLSLKTSAPNRLSLVVYDLIPIIAPEHCCVVKKFVHYAQLLRVADRVNCISESVKKDVENFSKIILRENPAPLEVSYLHLAGDFQAGESASLIPPVKAAVPRVLCVGTFEPRKNQTALLRAGYVLFKKGLKFEIAFAGNPGWKNDLFMAEKEELDPKGEFIKIFTRASDAELDSLYRSSKFTVFPSYIEGFGLPILESLQRGKPVIASNRGSMAEIADLVGGCVLVNPTDTAAIADAMEKFLTDEKFYQQKVAEIRSYDNLTWDRYSQELYQFATAGPLGRA